ncbi:MAG: glutathione S-transferase family protein [Alphaproteobacteria bacterium]|nr:glutathione S-transferase family protein [Alphaproteobacteria bacterium]
MIDFFGFGTANGQKVAIMLEETGLPYTLKPLDMMKGAHKSPEYLAVNPVGKMPAIVDHDGPGGKPLKVFETLAICLYLGEKSGKLIPVGLAERALAYEWSCVVLSDLGPAFSAQFNLKNLKADTTAAVDYYVQLVHRFLRVLDERLAAAPYLAGAEYSYADVQLYPVITVSGKRLGENGLAPYKHILGWRDRVSQRPAVKRGEAVLPGLF